MITIFAPPRAFEGDMGRRQHVALASWREVCPSAQIVLVGSDAGIAAAARDAGAEHLPSVTVNEFGKPHRGDVFRQAQRVARHDWLCFINADIVLLDDISSVVKSMPSPQAVAVGRRTDVDAPIDLATSDTRAMARRGKLHGWAAVDYVLFHRSLPEEFFPPFSVNYPGWDNWLLGKLKTAGRPIVDVTAVVTALHQDHEDVVRGYRKRSIWRDNPHARGELERAGGFGALLTIRESDYLLGASGLRKPAFPRRLLADLAVVPAWRGLLGLKRHLQQLVFVR